MVGTMAKRKRVREDGPGGAQNDVPVDNQDTPPPQTTPARFPSEPFERHEEHRALEPFINEAQTVFDPEFPEKQRPPKQQLIDREFLYHEVKDLGAFVAALTNILPFWMKHHHWFRDAATRMTFNIHQRSEPLRQEYNRAHNANISPMPNNLFEMEAWRFDVERAIAGVAERPGAKKQVMAGPPKSDDQPPPVLSQKPAGSALPEHIQLENGAYKILCTLGNSPTRLHQEGLRVCEDPPMDRRTVRRHLETLKEHGLVDYNPRNKQGAAITQKGKDRNKAPK